MTRFGALDWWSWLGIVFSFSEDSRTNNDNDPTGLARLSVTDVLEEEEEDGDGGTRRLTLLSLTNQTSVLTNPLLIVCNVLQKTKGPKSWIATLTDAS